MIYECHHHYLGDRSAMKAVRQIQDCRICLGWEEQTQSQVLITPFSGLVRMQDDPEYPLYRIISLGVQLVL